MLDRLKADIITAMKAKDAKKLVTLRSVKAEASNIALVDKRKEVTDADILSAVTKGIKQRQDSINEYTKANRTDLACVEQYELDVIKEYLPSQLTENEINTIIADALSSTGATTKKEMGKVMGFVMKKITKGTADNKLVSKLIGEKLT